MPQGIIEIRDWLAGNMNPSAFTLDSMEGVVVTLLALVILYRVTKDLAGFVGWCIGAMILIQLGYLFGFTALNDFFPFRDLFKYDLIASLAQMFAGTKIADVLLYFDAMLTYGAKTVSEFAVKLVPAIGRIGEAIGATEWPWEA